NLARVTGTGSFSREHGAWYYLPMFALGFLPWSLRVPAIARGLRRRGDAERAPGGERAATRRFLAGAFLAPDGMVSYAQSKLAYYLLPLAPPFALLATDALLRAADAAAASRADEANLLARRARRAALVPACFAVLLALGVAACAWVAVTPMETLLRFVP